MPEYASKPPMRRSPDLPYVVALLALFAASRRLRLPVEPLVVVLLAVGSYRAWLAVRERRPELGRRNAEALV